MTATLHTTSKDTASKGLRFEGGRVGVLLLHGLCGTPAEMRFVAMGLSRAGYTVHVPQLAGHGNENTGSWQDWYMSARAALIDLRRECDTVIVGGLCMGAILGLHLAARNPGKVQGVSLFSPTLWMNGWAMPWTARLFKLVRSRWFAGFMTFPDAASLGIKCPRVRQFVQQALSGEGCEYGRAGVPATMVLEHRRMVDAAKKLLPRVKQPTLIVHSLEDDYAAINNAEYLKGELTGQVDLVVLNDSYHMVTLDKQRHVVVESTRAFVARIVEEVRNIASPAMPVAA
ncbi:alpha/beta fold hydrolase [Hyphomicrobium sp. NDB2Meth4]|uniref:alpha/beta hydrolase n=1 Tax=Hyphomicrobium sp. NDB2Meth4 TaxID=1892846 RepID=UPI0009317226|nr:alpha/beta fold hydrolase [Hyphomicrobium sp. NDB2Meth4]